MNFARLRRQGSRYLLTGSASAVVDIGVFTLGLTAGLPIIPAATLSFLVATVANYLLTSRFVFHRETSLRRYLMFLAAASVGLVINVALTAYLAGHTLLPPVAAKVVSIGITFVFNFAVNALLVFRHAPE